MFCLEKGKFPCLLLSLAAVPWPTNSPGYHLLYLSHLWVCSCNSRNPPLLAAAVSNNLMRRGTMSPKYRGFIMVHWNANHFAKNKAGSCSVSGEFWICVPSPTCSFWQRQVLLILLHLFEMESTRSILPCPSTGGPETPNGNAMSAKLIQPLCHCRQTH